MKVILSRKGFDSASGGSANAILPDGRLVPFPIPERGAPKKYQDVRVNGVQIGELVEDLTRGKIPRTFDCHLDPDVDVGSVPRKAGWRPCFGQCSTAQIHLKNHEVGVGDLFLFLGWFRQVEQVSGTWRYVARAPDLHVLYGWLRIGQVVALHEGERPDPEPAFSDHPHLQTKVRKLNTLYLASDRLGVDGLDLPGGGTFGKIADRRILTDTSQHLRSVWQLPRWFHPEHGSTLTYHKPKKWQLDDNHSFVRSAGRGQEFVLTTDKTDLVREWLHQIFTA